MDDQPKPNPKLRLNEWTGPVQSCPRYGRVRLVRRKYVGKRKGGRFRTVLQVLHPDAAKPTTPPLGGCGELS